LITLRLFIASKVFRK